MFMQGCACSSKARDDQWIATCQSVYHSSLRKECGYSSIKTYTRTKVDYIQESRHRLPLTIAGSRYSPNQQSKDRHSCSSLSVLSLCCLCVCVCARMLNLSYYFILVYLIPVYFIPKIIKNINILHPLIKKILFFHIYNFFNIILKTIASTNIVCPITAVFKDLGKPISLKKINKESPVIIGGNKKGKKIKN
mgnify:CR=1 FL=1